MNHFTFTTATKERAKARIALIGPTGSGKTYTALLTATGLGGRIALVDTEHGSAAKYADEFAFDTLPLTVFRPTTLVDVLAVAAHDGYDVMIIDSLSHFWSGAAGCWSRSTTRPSASEEAATSPVGRRPDPRSGR
ncbi:AAA family ATPase [Streptosporangium lutulentum]